MKGSLLLVLVLLLGLWGCTKWRPKEYPDPNEVLPTAVWKLNFYDMAGYETDCRVPTTVVFNKDKTGFYYYANACDSPKIDTIKFSWYYNKGELRLMLTIKSGPDIGKVAQNQFIVCDYDQVNMICRSGNMSVYSKTRHLVDGYFKPL
ncbi:hypothetical protein GCM10023093_05880 [Nemorincola caseinilytica]|uniref:Lipoprotein n=1 Tax=Nemorincola caseinilytica TaxID=2054315 RepID=A0ABP8N8N4_9BACT